MAVHSPHTCPHPCPCFYHACNPSTWLVALYSSIQMSSHRMHILLYFIHCTYIIRERQGLPFGIWPPQKREKKSGDDVTMQSVCVCVWNVHTMDVISQLDVLLVDEDSMVESILWSWWTCIRGIYIDGTIAVLHRCYGVGTGTTTVVKWRIKLLGWMTG